MFKFLFGAQNTKSNKAERQVCKNKIKTSAHTNTVQKSIFHLMHSYSICGVHTCRAMRCAPMITSLRLNAAAPTHTLSIQLKQNNVFINREK